MDPLETTPASARSHNRSPCETTSPDPKVHVEFGAIDSPEGLWTVLTVNVYLIVKTVIVEVVNVSFFPSADSVAPVMLTPLLME